MHPDLDLSGLLQEAYRGDLKSEAEKERLLRAAGFESSGPGSTRGVTWVPILIAILLLLGHVS